jgi:putative ABC transport system permease protein
MNIFTLSWKNFRVEIFKKSLNIILISLGIIIINSILLLSNQLENRLNAHAGKVDLVVGAKGSPLQLILSSIYHADFPTGNISLSESEKLINHPLVKQAVPVSIGDSYNGFRVIGTNQQYLDLFQLNIQKGRTFRHEFEAIAGFEAAKNLKLDIGSIFYSAHGLTEGAANHNGHAFKIVGIMDNSGTIADQLILTPLESIWHTHDFEGEETDKEITSLLIKYKTPLAIATFPAIVNSIPNLQAASPALETARLFSLLSSGFKIIETFGYILILLAAFSVFIIMYNALLERRMDIALIRSMGASRFKVFSIMITEGLLVTIIGTLFGIIASHILIQASSFFLPAQQATALTGYVFIQEELWVITIGLITGLIASIIPAIGAYKADISAILNKG